MASLLRNVQSKSAEFCCFHRHIENEATTMQRNGSAHTAWMSWNPDTKWSSLIQGQLIVSPGKKRQTAA